MDDILQKNYFPLNYNRAMTKQLAKKFINDYYEEEVHSEESRFLLRESLEYLYRTTGKANYALQLGGTYYSERDFDLAEHYYKIAAELGSIDAYECLGYVYYYGRTGKPDYEKAFYCYKKVMEETGDIEATYKIADMYRNGYYVEKDERKYEEIIESLYPRVKDENSLSSLLPEVFSRLGTIRIQQKRYGEAYELFLEAKDFLAQRMQFSSFFGNATTMKFIIQGLYTVTDFDDELMNLYDLYYLFKTPCEVSFTLDGKRYVLKIPEEKNAHPICFEGKWYQDVTDFLYNATIDGKPIRTYYSDFDDFQVKYE